MHQGLLQNLLLNNTLLTNKKITLSKIFIVHRKPRFHQMQQKFHQMEIGIKNKLITDLQLYLSLSQSTQMYA
jgi:hypothetical protein